MNREKYPGYTEKLEYELDKRFKAKTPDQKFIDLYAAAEKTTNEYFQNNSTKGSKEE